jgi:hypothetical protein
MIRHISRMFGSVRVADYEMQARTIGRRNDLIAFLKRQSERLLDQNMLALLHRFNGLFRVKSMRRRDVDGFNGRIPAQIMKVRINRRVELTSEALARTRQRVHGCTESDSRMCHRRTDHKRAGEPKSCNPETNRRRCGGRIGGDFHETSGTPVHPPALEQRAERAVKEHEVVEPYATSRQPPVRTSLS